MRVILLLLAILWIQLFASLAHTWRHGEYYEFGWFVPWLALGLAWRRWSLIAPEAQPAAATTSPRSGILLATAILLAAAAIIPLRLIGTMDPGWRPPILLHALLVCTGTHALLWILAGRRISLTFIPVTIFALSAVPYPWRIEQEVIRALTGIVLMITHDAFLITGHPVELLGENLVLGHDVVEVNDGCSGIRSFQTLVMVALFFGELFLLPVTRRIALLAVAAASAIVFNTIRAYWLANTHFFHGVEAANAAHDRIGHTTFLLSAATLWLAAYLLLQLDFRRRTLIRRSHQKPAP